MGRTGKWWAIEHFGVEPDIITSAKGIASGLPLGACIAREFRDELAQRDARQHLWRQSDFLRGVAGNHRTARREYLANAAEVGQYTMDALEEIQARHPSIGDVRGKGLMIGVEFVKDKDTKEPNEAHPRHGRKAWL